MQTGVRLLPTSIVTGSKPNRHPVGRYLTNLSTQSKPEDEGFRRAAHDGGLAEVPRFRFLTRRQTFENARGSGRKPDVFLPETVSFPFPLGD